jgi:2-keto-4-pentenoate hydratase/2-oxohepta-3-ene-1,7-dioic acid hydratase in catechol pathway
VVAASRLDLRDTEKQQVRAENQERRLNSDRAAQLKSAPTARDSARVTAATEPEVRQVKNRLGELTRKADSIAAVIPLQRRGMATGNGTPARANPAAAQADYEAEAAKVKKAVSLGIDEATARAAYDEGVKLIAKRHGQMR